MLIVCTQDEAVRAYARSARSNAGRWGTLNLCSVGDQAKATKQIVDWLKTVPESEPICFSAHGNDKVFGDEGSKKGKDWTWTFADLAAMFEASKPHYKGNVLLSICSPESEEIKAAAGTFALALEGLKICKSSWIYGPIWSTPVEQPFPEPAKLDKQSDLTAVRVA